MPILLQLLKAETAEREVRSTAYQLKAVRFPAYRDLTGFDFASSEVDEALVGQLHRCAFLDDAHNVVLVGDPSTGKTHIATALGVQAVEHHHKRVRFFFTVELVNALKTGKGPRQTGQIAGWLAYADLVILDELGYPADVALIFPVAGRGRPRKNQIPDQLSVSAETVLAGARWREVSWRRGIRGPLSARFAACRIRIADGPPQRIHDKGQQHMPGEEAWLVGEWRSSGERKYYLSNLPAGVSLPKLAPPSRRAGCASRAISR